MLLNKSDLFNILYGALHWHTAAMFYMDGDNPYRFSFNGRVIHAFIGNVHPAGRSDPDEFRIQCPGDLPVTLSASLEKEECVFILGFSGDANVFCAWDPRRFVVRNPKGQRFSIYTRLSCIRRASEQGFSVYTDANEQRVVMFRQDLLGLYLEYATLVHQASPNDLQRIAKAYDAPGSIRRLTVNRQKIEIATVAYPRSPAFQKAVLRAYSNRCAMCGIQLGLIDAAHIIPHSHPEGEDIVNNGLALCALHHRSYDVGLVYVQENYSIQLNMARLRLLRKLKKSEGLKKFQRSFRASLLLPSELGSYPSPKNLSLANDLRGIGSSQ